MKKLLPVLLFVLIYFPLAAQTSTDSPKLYPLTNVYSTTGFSAISLYDSYLSELDYLGLGLSFEEESSRYVDPSKPNLKYWSRESAQFGLLTNPMATSGMEYAGADIAHGLKYSFNVYDELIIEPGVFGNLAGGFKYNVRNVNNPVNVDLAANLNLSASVHYNFELFNKTIFLRFALEAPVLGVMYVPQFGSTYYETFSLKNYADIVHFSSLHNKIGLNREFAFDIPMRHSVWTFGLRAHSLRYQANNLSFNTLDNVFFIGVNYDIYRFSGTKARIPENFISPKNKL